MNPGNMSLTDEEALGLSRRVSYDQLEDIGVQFGFSLTEIHNLKKQYRDDTREITIQMIQGWRMKDSDGTASKQRVEDILASLNDPSQTEKAKPKCSSKKMITPKLSLDACRKKLIDQYTRTGKISLKPWDRTSYTDFDDLHTNIDLFFKNKGQRGGEDGKRMPLPGSINDIFKTKVDGSLPPRILLLGKPGHGKTTLVAKMAYDWATKDDDSPLKDVPLVFALKYRRTTKDTSLGEAIVSQLLGRMKGVTPEEIEEFLSDNDEDCVILLDGFDEFSGSLSTEDHKSSLVELTLFQQFPGCRVLVTSRPEGKVAFEDADLLFHYAVMEIQGFTKEKSDEYMDRFFRSDPLSSNDLKKYLKRKREIRCLVEIPFYCMAICTLWQSDLLKSVDSQSSLFDNLLMYMVQHSRSKGNVGGLPTTRNISANELKSLICSVGEVAFVSFKTDADRVVFSLKDFEHCQGALDIAVHIGLVSKQSASAEPAVWFEEPPMIIEFYHKLAQEHCIGIYLSSLSPAEFEGMMCDLVPLGGLSKAIHMLNFLGFASGSAKDACKSIVEHILSHVQAGNVYRHSMALLSALQTLKDLFS